MWNWTGQNLGSESSAFDGTVWLDLEKTKIFDFYNINDQADDQVKLREQIKQTSVGSSKDSWLFEEHFGTLTSL